MRTPSLSYYIIKAKEQPTFSTDSQLWMFELKKEHADIYRQLILCIELIKFHNIDLYYLAEKLGIEPIKIKIALQAYHGDTGAETINDIKL
jgi:hypothetical protein